MVSGTKGSERRKINVEEYAFPYGKREEGKGKGKENKR